MNNINQNYIIRLFETYWNTIPQKFKNIFLDWSNVGVDRPGITPLEAFLLYAMVLEEEPSMLFEMGTRQGSITLALGAAQQQRGKRGCYISTECVKHSANIARHMMSNVGLNEYVDIQCGNGIVLAPQNIDMCVIDADHSYQFAKKYIEKLFPKCLPGCLIFAHDHIPYTQKSYNTDGQVDLIKDIKVTPREYEERAIKEYLLQTGKSYCFTEAIFGGRHTPINVNMRKILCNITGVNLFKQYKCAATSIFYRL